MKPTFKATCAILALTITLTGCSTSGISTHGNNLSSDRSGVHEDSSRHNWGKLFGNKSDYVSDKGDASKRHLLKGQENFAAQNYGLAEKNFRLAVEQRTDNASAWLGLAASYDQLGRFDFADRAYKQLVQLKKDNARVLNNMGYSQLLRGNYSKARRLLNRAQNLDPTLEEIQGNIHLLEETINS